MKSIIWPKREHPLEQIVLAEFEKQGVQDRISIAIALAGQAPVPLRGYREVAEHVLESMRRRGVLWRDELGWYSLKPSRGAEEGSQPR